MNPIGNIGKEINDIQEKEKIVAFIDILGFKEKVEKDTDIVRIIDIIMLHNRKEAEEDLLTFMFSDCMYIIGDNLSKVLELISCIQIQLLVASKKELSDDGNWTYADLILVRGGITKGKVGYNKNLNIFWGKAINRAYELESKSAFYPRVLIDRQIDTFLNNDYFEQDFDGLCYFNYLKFLFYEKEGYFMPKEEINEIKRHIEKFMRDENDENILRKIGWFYNYFAKYTCGR